MPERCDFVVQLPCPDWIGIIVLLIIETIVTRDLTIAIRPHQYNEVNS